MIQNILRDKQKLSEYHQGAIQRLNTTRELRQQRWQKSHALVEKAAQTLREKYDVSKIVLFGSILDLDTFTQWSDIDIAVWGLEAHQTLSAIETVENLSDEIEINLVDINTVKPEIYQQILEQHREI